MTIPQSEHPEPDQHAESPSASGSPELARFVPHSEHGQMLAAHRDAVLPLASEHGVSNVCVFGSTVRGTETSASDIDLLVDIEPTMSLFGLARVEIALSTLLGLPVEVVPARSLKPWISERVTHEAVAL